MSRVKDPSEWEALLRSPLMDSGTPAPFTEEEEGEAFLALYAQVNGAPLPEAT
jgi:hypothetical protein